jgi:hypothetical protein
MGLCVYFISSKNRRNVRPGFIRPWMRGEKESESLFFFFLCVSGSCFVAVHWVLYCTPAVPPCRRWWPRLTRCNVWRTISYSVPIVLYLLAVLSLSLSPVSWLVCVGHRGLSAGIWYPDIKVTTMGNAINFGQWWLGKEKKKSFFYFLFFFYRGMLLLSRDRMGFSLSLLLYLSWTSAGACLRESITSAL